MGGGGQVVELEAKKKCIQSNYTKKKKEQSKNQGKRNGNKEDRAVMRVKWAKGNGGAERKTNRGYINRKQKIGLYTIK